jgi:hypothetical protein
MPIQYGFGTDTPLIANGLFSQQMEVDFNYVTTLYVSVYSDQASATGGLTIEGSIDNKTFYPLIAPISVVAATPQVISLTPIYNSILISYTNGATAQTKFMLVAAFTNI